MKRIALWILAIQFATGFNLVNEVLRLPELMEHYKMHQQEAPDVTLFGFLWLHYGNTQHEYSDTRHHSLPFHQSANILAEAVHFPASWLNLDLVRVPKEEKNNLLISDEFLRLSPPLSGIFRPPLV